MQVDPFARTHLFLTGYRGCGKTTLAHRLSEELKIPRLDTDDWVEQKANMSIAQIFEERGEIGFRDLESQAIDTVSRFTEPHIVSLGGGAILREANRLALKSLGWVVWLTAEPETIFSRIASDPTTTARRPALSQLGQLDEIKSLLAKRESLYREVAQSVVATDKMSLTEATDRVCEAYRNWLLSIRD